MRRPLAWRPLGWGRPPAGDLRVWALRALRQDLEQHTLVIGAETSLAADSDLYLEKLQPDGSWAAVIAGT